jgi:hypothetical protein
VSADLQKNDAARHLISSLDLVDPPVPEFARPGADDMVLSSSPGHRSFICASPVIPEVPPAEPDLFEVREHTFVKTTFSKRKFGASAAIRGFWLIAHHSISSRQLSGVHPSREEGRRVVLPL